MNEAVAASGLIGLGVAILFVRLAALDRRLNRLARLEAKLDALLKQQDIEFDAFAGVPPGVREALEEGRTIEAIRRFRQATGVGLKEAKDFIDELRARRAASRSGVRP
jgi:hypothetical protein